MNLIVTLQIMFKALQREVLKKYKQKKDHIIIISHLRIMKVISSLLVPDRNININTKGKVQNERNIFFLLLLHQTKIKLQDETYSTWIVIKRKFVLRSKRSVQFIYKKNYALFKYLLTLSGKCIYV